MALCCMSCHFQEDVCTKSYHVTNLLDLSCVSLKLDHTLNKKRVGQLELRNPHVLRTTSYLNPTILPKENIVTTFV